MKEEEHVEKNTGFLTENDGYQKIPKLLFIIRQSCVKQEEYWLCFSVSVRLWEWAKVPDGVYCPRLTDK